MLLDSVQVPVGINITIFLFTGRNATVEIWSFFLIQMNYKVDPAIIGGMVVSIGDKFADMSIASKMKKYTDLIQAAA